MTTDSIPIEQRQVIFRALIEAQDGGSTVSQSRADVARKYSVPVDQVKDIEREGIDGQWPPL